MPATLTEIAKVAGVSVATVSRVLNNVDHPINEKTRQRILKLAKELNYQPNLVARSLRIDSTNTVGIIIESMMSPFIPPIVSGIQDTLKPAGYLSFILNTNDDPNIEIESLNMLNNRQIDGILFVATWDRSPKMVEQMTTKPHVFIHRHFDSYADNCVAVDERWGARLAVSHLANLGHQRIAFINGDADWDASIYRLKGYQEELKSRGIPYDPDLVTNQGWESEHGRSGIETLFNRGASFSAVFASNDLLAMGAIHALQDRGLLVPQDIAVIGYDDRAFSSFVRPAISTVTLPAYEMGEEAASLLLRMMKGEITSSKAVEVRGRLLVRESCGASLSRRTLNEDMA
jgi:LacI family transcriptional regulator